MISKTLIADIVQDQKDGFLKKKCIERTKPIAKSTKRVVIISGVRRCGKSTLIRNLFLKKDDAIYINFEDPRLISFELSDFTRLEELLKEEKKSHLLLDEVQIIPHWELYARSAHEKGIPLIITGSNASMLSRELGTKLTGRYKQIELFPFNFTEFLSFFSLERNKDSFDQYFELGGFPEYLEEKDNNYHRLLLRDIITRDIAIRRNISNEKQLMRLAVHLLSNIGKKFSYNKLTKLLEIKSVRTVIDYCDYLSESYLLEYVPMYSTSIKKQIVNAKKAYSIDPAFAKANSLSFSQDLGLRLENFVYLKLRHDDKSIYYYKNANSECDFLIKENEQVVSLVQVCWEVNNDNMLRELTGIKNAMAETGVNNGIILTSNQEDVLDGIPLVPVWKWV